jgi:phospholipase C
MMIPSAAKAPLRSSGFLFLALVAAASGCASHSNSASPMPPVGAGSTHAATHAKHRRDQTSVQHVVVIIQENRTFDNLFAGFPNANTQNYGLNHLGQQVPLVQVPINQGFDPAHGHANFVGEADYNQSSRQYRMDGFDLQNHCAGNPSCPHSVYTYVQQSDVANYWTLAQQYAIGDMTFQANMGPSFESHQYLIAGQNGGYQATHFADIGNPMGTVSCSNPGLLLSTIDMTTPYPGKQGKKQSVCGTYPTILDELDSAGITWKYYARSQVGYWTAPNAVQSLFTNDQSKVIVPETQVLTDIANHALPAVAYVTPNDTFSDHPYSTLTNHGQDWIALITNAIGGDPYYWNDTVVLVTWDDWGGFYDHVPPPFAVNPAGGNPDPMEYGMRVPLLVVGPYVIPGTVDHTVRSADGILTFIESVFGLPSLGTLDAQSDNLSAVFNWSQAANVYQQLSTHGFTGARARYEATHMSGPPDTDMP